jgi:BirA family biotin operon repressor/biotin-[acetyl-CoA-carboxylase] ligase
MPDPDTVAETRIDADWIRNTLAQAGAAAAGVRLQVVERTGSTNSDLLQAARAGAYPSAALLAREQTAGRGRQERPWVSIHGDSLALSVGHPLPRPAQGLGGLSLAIGVAVCEVLAEHGARAQLKWPNDVVVHQPEGLAKLAGILVETLSMPGGTYVVVGVGLNLRGAAALRAATGRAVTDVQSLAGHADANRLTAALIARVVHTLDRFARHGFAAFHAAFEAADALRGRPARVTEGTATLRQGIVRGVNAEGALLLETEQGVAAVLGGELSLRPLDP